MYLQSIVKIMIMKIILIFSDYFLTDFATISRHWDTIKIILKIWEGTLKHLDGNFEHRLSFVNFLTFFMKIHNSEAAPEVLLSSVTLTYFVASFDKQSHRSLKGSFFTLGEAEVGSLQFSSFLRKSGKCWKKEGNIN